jgi:hypothetical protein
VCFKEQSECANVLRHFMAERVSIYSISTHAVNIRATFPRMSNNCVRNFWRAKAMRSERRARLLAVSRCPRERERRRRFIKMEVSKSEFQRHKSVSSRCAHPVSTPRSAPRECAAAAVTQINESENAKTILSWLVC